MIGRVSELLHDWWKAPVKQHASTMSGHSPVEDVHVLASVKLHYVSFERISDYIIIYPML